MCKTMPVLATRAVLTWERGNWDSIQDGQTIHTKTPAPDVKKEYGWQGNGGGKQKLPGLSALAISVCFECKRTHSIGQ